MNIQAEKIKKILISRTDAIGDVVLTLPLAGYLKEKFPHASLAFLGKTYTYPVISKCSHVDEFYNYDTFSGFDADGRIQFLKDINPDLILHVFPREDVASAARSAGIKYRIGTSHRLFHWWTCNQLVSFSRKNSALHEAQLNFQLLKNFGLEEIPTLDKIAGLYGLAVKDLPPEHYLTWINSAKSTFIIHPGSNASAREWSLAHYRDLMRYLPSAKFQFAITGTESEQDQLQDFLSMLPANAINLVGKLSLDELLAFIARVDGIVSASTGPLHIAAALGKHAIGIYPPIRPMHPGRWAPAGVHSKYFCVERACNDCRNNPKKCHCMNEISSASVADYMLALV